ncbi:MAG: hypothetical protein LBH16_06340 [Treponema sp.]|jgi:hypothetical protein|nr:hypothetical protein [Treponema sp.]
MKRNEFISQYNVFSKRAFACAEKARREGLLSLEDEIEPEKIAARDIFEYGISLVIDGTDSQIVDKILSNIVAQDTDEFSRLFKTIQKEATLLLYSGIHPRLLCAVLNSYTDLPLSDDVVTEEGTEDGIIDLP